jgi:hypothetical protein
MGNGVRLKLPLKAAVRCGSAYELNCDGRK